MVPDKEYFDYTEEEYAAYLEERQIALEDYGKKIEEMREAAKNGFEYYQE